eukprot:CAMPEP_0174825176 /NCGR_PEP_ID=MMETSP1107-20130205/42508_1 /TAXON_ID=36770 /ORGANISM="Paraphysomonas vestita, Strain GFlagA" /LENGTH=159 /DNA_ID=CAMNT_0016056547 /DNA_START=566 /DNA_END=1045 /DNA_ORIENTATION=+
MTTRTLTAYPAPRPNSAPRSPSGSDFVFNVATSITPTNSITPSCNSDIDAVHYFTLIGQLINRINQNFNQGNRYSAQMSHHGFQICRGVHRVFLRANFTALDLSNIYYMMKAMEQDMERFIQQLNDNPFPTIVQAVRTGGTPPVNSDLFNIEGHEEYNF